MSQEEVIEFFKKYPEEIFTRKEVFYGKLSETYGIIEGLCEKMNESSFYRSFKKVKEYINEDFDGNCWYRR